MECLGASLILNEIEFIETKNQSKVTAFKGYRKIWWHLREEESMGGCFNCVDIDEKSRRISKN